MPTAVKVIRLQCARHSNLSLLGAQSAPLAGSSAVSLNSSLAGITCGVQGPDTSNFQLQQQQMMFYQQQQQQQQMGMMFNQRKQQQQQLIGFSQPQFHVQYPMGMAMSKRQCMAPSLQQPSKPCGYCMYQNLAPSPFHNTVVGSFCSGLTTKLHNYLLRHFIVVH